MSIHEDKVNDMETKILEEEKLHGMLSCLCEQFDKIGLKEILTKMSEEDPETEEIDHDAILHKASRMLSQVKYGDLIMKFKEKSSVSLKS
jgi:hypothetical protein